MQPFKDGGKRSECVETAIAINDLDAAAAGRPSAWSGSRALIASNRQPCGVLEAVVDVV